MRYRDAVAFRQALEHRLKADAGGDPARLAMNRKRVAFERLLARLVAVAPGRWLLKGGFALDLRIAEGARATKDVDIEWRDDADELAEVVIRAAEHDAGDFFAFAIERAGAPEDRLGGARRFRVSATLAARSFESFLLDVGFRAHEIVAETLTTSDLLAFAGIPPVEVEVVPVEFQVAEKVHAYTRTYEGGRASTRPKDLVDLVLIARLTTLDAIELREAIQETFTRRETHAAPDELPAPPGEWATPFRELAEAVGVPGDLGAGHGLAALLLDPVLGGGVTSGTWDPRKARWTGRG